MILLEIYTNLPNFSELYYRVLYISAPISSFDGLISLAQITQYRLVYTKQGRKYIYILK